MTTRKWMEAFLAGEGMGFILYGHLVVGLVVVALGLVVLPLVRTFLL